MHICVFCASSDAVPDVYRRAAADLGRLLGERGHTLVYGGSNIGLMGVLAGAARDAGARVVGIIPRRLLEAGIAEESLDELVVTETMAQRKEAMEARSEGFIALPGGFGTLEEVAQAITLRQLRYLEGGIVLLNTDGFYRHLLAHLEHLYETGFAQEGYRETYHVATTPEAAVDYLERYRPPALPTKWELRG